MCCVGITRSLVFLFFCWCFLGNGLRGVYPHPPPSFSQPNGGIGRTRPREALPRAPTCPNMTCWQGTQTTRARSGMKRREAKPESIARRSRGVGQRKRQDHVACIVEDPQSNLRDCQKVALRVLTVTQVALRVFNNAGDVILWFCVDQRPGFFSHCSRTWPLFFSSPTWPV